MGRWEPGALERLQVAALELFTEQGFESTTVTEIAGRAGLTTRTFFRYFSDKREVLFAGAEALQAALVEKTLAANDQYTPLHMIAVAVAGVEWEAIASRAVQRQRRAVIVASPDLLERELIKFDILTTAFADALRARDVETWAARRAARAGMATFRSAYERWLELEDSRGMAEIMDEELARLRATVAPHPSADTSEMPLALCKPSRHQPARRRR